MCHNLLKYQTSEDPNLPLNIWHSYMYERRSGVTVPGIPPVRIYLGCTFVDHTTSGKINVAMQQKKSQYQDINNLFILSCYHNSGIQYLMNK